MKLSLVRQLGFVSFNTGAVFSIYKIVYLDNWVKSMPRGQSWQTFLLWSCPSPLAVVGNSKVKKTRIIRYLLCYTMGQLFNASYCKIWWNIGCGWRQDWLGRSCRELHKSKHAILVELLTAITYTVHTTQYYRWQEQRLIIDFIILRNQEIYIKIKVKSLKELSNHHLVELFSRETIALFNKFVVRDH